VAEDGQEYPGVEWKFGVKSFSVGDGGEFNLTFSQSVTPRLGEGVSFRPKGIEVYGPEGVVVTSGKRQKLDQKITQRDTEYDPESQEELAALLHEVTSGSRVKEIRITTDEGKVFVISQDKPLQHE
jgi:hypothetical protein